MSDEHFPVDGTLNALGIRDADEHIGVVAQEVQRVIPEAETGHIEPFASCPDTYPF